MGRGLNYSGLVIAGIGFFFTRFTVTLALYEDPIRFYLAGVVPLGMGLGLAAFGVALVVADVEPTVVRTTAAWCVIGAGTMFGVTLLTVLGSNPGVSGNLTRTLSQSYLSNFLIVGSIGGTLTGLYAARTRRQQRAVHHHANTLVILNRLLRHEVLNAITVIRGYALLDDTEGTDTESVLKAHSDAVVETIDNVKYLTKYTGQSTPHRGDISLESAIETGIADVRAAHPEVDVTVSGVAGGVTVRADDQLATVVAELIENAVVHAGNTNPEMSVMTAPATVRFTVTDTGSGLPRSQQALLEAGDIEEFDDPQTGFGLNVVRFLVEGYDGTIETTVDESGTTIAVTLPRAQPHPTDGASRALAYAVAQPGPIHLAITVVAALLAGVGYGVASQVLGGSIAGIGVFYGIADPVVGWLTHEFHSIVFGLIFLGLLSVLPRSIDTTIPVVVGVGLGWALLLWSGAAGIIAPIWLQLLGIPAAIPNLTYSLLISHLAWGVSLSVFTIIGFTYVAPTIIHWRES